jgi:hypothetical protein
MSASIHPLRINLRGTANINHVADARPSSRPHHGRMSQQHATQPARRRPARGTSGSAQLARYRRVGPIVGLLGLACYAAGSLAAALPMPTSSTHAMISHLATDRSKVLTGLALMFLALPFLLMFLGYLWDLLAQAEGHPRILARLSAGSWLTLLVIIAAGMIPVSAVAWQGASVVPPDIVRFAVEISNLSLYSLSAPVAAASVLAPAIVIWRSRALPRWLAWLGLIEVAGNIAELAGLYSNSGTDAAGYGAGVGPALWILWAAALSIAALAARPPTAPPSSETSAESKDLAAGIS